MTKQTIRTTQDGVEFFLAPNYPPQPRPRPRPRPRTVRVERAAQEFARMRQTLVRDWQVLEPEDLL